MITSPSKFRPPGALALISTAYSLCLALPGGAEIPDDHGEIDEYVDASTCEGCHESDPHAEVMATIHWNWNHTDAASGQVLGKKNVINNYCVANASNEPRCTSCHIGVGWTSGEDFDFTDRSKVDCLVCHDTTGTYFKTPTGAGASGNTQEELNIIAQNAGLPVSRRNCGACHFYGGGGDAVKHGDLDSTMENPDGDLDVHMGSTATGGRDFTCASCHSGTGSSNSHELVGTRYPTTTLDHELCLDCHESTLHDKVASELKVYLNKHAERVACQTCHIPAYARGGKATKMTWDWSTAGNKNEDGSDRVIKDADGNVLYHSKKGTFTWEENVIPEIQWFNGEVTYANYDWINNPAYAVHPGDLVTINKLHGAESDANALLFPVKRFTGRQPYDDGGNSLAVPHLFPYLPKETDTTAYWKKYDWGLALAEGNDYIGKTFMGPVGFIETESFWIENHMVAPKEKALHCSDCHSPDSRLSFLDAGYDAGEAAFYQNVWKVTDGLGIVMAAPGTTAELRWMSEVGYEYAVQSSTDLKKWVTQPDGVFTAGAAPEEFLYTDSPDGGLPMTKYYRVVRKD